MTPELADNLAAAASALTTTDPRFAELAKSVKTKVEDYRLGLCGPVAPDDHVGPFDPVAPGNVWEFDFKRKGPTGIPIKPCLVLTAKWDGQSLQDTVWSIYGATKEKKAKKSTSSNIMAGWEESGGNEPRCRWFVAWEKTKETQKDGGTEVELAGIIAGYAAGGSYLMESFRCTYNDLEMRSLIIDDRDVVSGQEVEPPEDPDKKIEEAETRGWASIWEWNQEGLWEESDTIRLKKSKIKKLTKDKDMFLLNIGYEEIWIENICKQSSLTAGPLID